jgi:hypothetical protein
MSINSILLNLEKIRWQREISLRVPMYTIQTMTFFYRMP